MVGGNQTRLGLVHQKPGTRRTLNGKRAVNPASTKGDGKTEQLSTEQLLEKASALTQTMEEKLAEYKKGKKEENRAKNGPPTAITTRSSRSTTKKAEETNRDGSTQRTLRSMMQASVTTTAIRTTSATSSEKSSSSSSTTITESITTIESTDSTVIEVEQDVQDDKDEEPEDHKAQDTEPVNRDAQVQTDDLETVLEKRTDAPISTTVVQHAEEKSEDAADDSVVPTQEGSPRKAVARKEVVKPVAADTVHLTEDGDEDNIHPLARTVVKSTSRPLHRKPHTEDTSNHDSTDNAYQPVNIPSKSLRKIVVQESAMPESLLPLPSHMGALLELFKGLDNVLEFTKRQGQLCFYHKLRKHVELQSGRNFEVKHLAQLKTVLPEGYKLTEAPCLFEGAKTRSILIDTPTLKEELEGNFVPEGEKRRKLFVDRLYDRIKTHHQAFLFSTTPHRTDTYPYEWHPDFDLETVAPVEETDIPLLKPSVVDTSKLSLKNLGARRDIVRAPTKSPTILQDEGGASTSKEKPQPVTSSDFPPDAPVTKTLSALEQLKERIRQKQLEKKDQTRGMASPEEKRQALIASRLPAVFDLIRFKRVEVMSLKALTEQVVKSSRQPVSEVEGRDSLEMLAKVLPEWCTVFGTNDGVKYFKVIRDDGHGNRILHDERALRTRLVTKSVGP
ncbi:hypothetical protein BGX33_011793 [Mortierella sp. NVP41]|nr:hypothetical protein BGX33_011793 [Mortierella sp. NVP41]